MDVKSADDVRAANPANQADQQPWQPCAGQGPHAIAGFDVFRDTAGQLVIPFGIFDDGVNRIVNGDAPEQTPSFIHHW